MFIPDINMKFLLVSVWFLYLLNSAFSLVCYKCFGSNEDPNCYYPKEAEVCSGVETMCATWLFTGSTSFNKACTPDCKKELEKENAGVEGLTCCDEDLCNGSGNLSYNNLLIFAVVYTVSKLFF